MNQTSAYPQAVPTDGEATRQPLATFLGLFSVGLGLAEAVAPERVAEWTGAPRLPSLIRAYGLRELAAGVGLLAGGDPAPWLWGRVAGDVLDLGTLAAGFADADAGRRRRLLASVAAVAGVTALDVLAATRSSRA